VGLERRLILDDDLLARLNFDEGGLAERLVSCWLFPLFVTPYGVEGTGWARCGEERTVRDFMTGNRDLPINLLFDYIL